MNWKGVKNILGMAKRRLTRAWKTGDLTKAAHLRCVKHLEGNLQAEATRDWHKREKETNFFLEKVFGCPRQK